MDTGFTYMYYPSPSNFSNAAITGGPIYGGTSVIIEGSGFTRGYRSDKDIDLNNLIMRCRFTDKPSVVGFRACPPDPASRFPSATPLTVAFDVPTNGLQLARDEFSGMLRLLTALDVDELFVFTDANGQPTPLADTYVGEWIDERTLRIYATEAAQQAADEDDDGAAGVGGGDGDDDDGPKSRLVGGSGILLSLRPGQTKLRLRSTSAAPPYLPASAPVITRNVPLSACFGANGTANDGGGDGGGGGGVLEPRVTFVTPIELTPTRVVCKAPARSAPVVSDLELALNGLDYHSNALTYSYYIQPTSLTHLTPVTAGPTIGGSVITVHGEGLAAFRAWGADADNARCRWHGTELTVPTALTDTQLVCPSASMPFTSPTEVSLEVALNGRDYIAISAATALRFTYYVQPRFIKAISPTGGRMTGATSVTVDGGGFMAYPGVNISDVRFGWGDTELTNLTTPAQLSDSRVVVQAYPADEPGPAQLFLTLNNLDLFSINASFLYYRQPSIYSEMDPTGGPTRGGTSVTIQGGPFDVFSTDRSMTICRFGSNALVTAERFDANTIVCRTPPATEPGTVQVAVSFNGADTDFGLIGHAFKYYQQPRPKGYVGSGISGSSSSSSSSRRRSLQQQYGGVLGGAGATEEDLSEIAPVGGPRGGGTRVTILGRGFTAFSTLKSFIRCRWQATIVDQTASIMAQEQDLPPAESGAIEHTDTRIVCPAPSARAGAAAVVNLTLSLNAADYGDTGLTFQYYALPRVRTITPSGGHRTGGTVVTIMGEGFDVLEGGKYVSCQYGSPYNPAYNERYTITKPSLVTFSAIVCAAPSTKVTDTRELWVALNGFALGSGRDPRPTGQNYTYYNPPLVVSVLPQAGVFSGGTVVTLLGQGFFGLNGNKNLASCRFVTSNSVSDTPPEILNPDLWTCRSPNQTAIAEGEAALVLVTLNAQQYVDTTYRFSYYGLRIDDVLVNGGPPGGVAGGATIVTLSGYGFHTGPVKFCRFGLLPRVEVLQVSAERLLCATPPSGGLVGDVHLLVSNDDVVYIDTGLDYTYYNQPTLFSSVSPEGGPKRGGTRVTLSGEGFTAFVSESQPLTSDQKRQAARCLWGGTFSSALEVAGLLRNAPRTSPTASGGATMSGKAGITAPTIVRAVVDDPDNADSVFSAGDTLTIIFDMATNRAADAGDGQGELDAASLAGDRTLVDELFSFSHPLGSRYHGRWIDASIFRITMVDTSGSALPVDNLNLVSVAVVGDIKDVGVRSRWCKAVAPLSGSAGTQEVPSIALFDSQTWDLQDVGWSRYDTLRVTSDLPTDLGGREGGSAFVDTTLSFSHSLGADYSGVWTDDSTFEITILDASGAGGGPPVGKDDGAVLSVAARLFNAPMTSGESDSSFRLALGNFGRSGATPSLLRFFARDHDNANSSYDAGDQLVVQFDMNVNRGACQQHVISVDNLPICARRASGGMALVDSLLSVSATIGANYSGEWEDGSTFVVTVVTPLPDAEHAPRPYDTVLSIPESARITDVAETAPPLAFGPTLLGVAEITETFPTPPRLVDALVSDFTNRDLMPARGDTIALRFDVPIDKAGGLYNERSGILSCVDLAEELCGYAKFESAQLHMLFDFFEDGQPWRRIVRPFFLEYSTGWLDDSTFVLEVINGSNPVQPGILAAEWTESTTASADTGTVVAIKPGVAFQSLSCPAKYSGTPYCVAPTGMSKDDMVDGVPYVAPRLRGDFGRTTGPRIVGFSADDPDNGDGAFGDGDKLTITFDQRTNRGRTHTNFERKSASVVSGGEVQTVAYPIGVSELSGRSLVDALFAFSHGLGADYSGEWTDDSTFVVTVVDATGADAKEIVIGAFVNVTALPSGGISAYNHTAKTCANVTHMRLYYPEDYGDLLFAPNRVNSSLHGCELHYANTTSGSLVGDLGVPTFPTLLSAVVDDVDNGDEVYGVGDVIVLQFDMPTDRAVTDQLRAAAAAGGGAGVGVVGGVGGPNGTVSGAQSSVDALFAFSEGLGAQYSGEWVQADRFAVTILDANGGGVMLGQTEVSICAPCCAGYESASLCPGVTVDAGGAAIRNAAGDALIANNSATLTGDFGVLSEPEISRFTVVVPANASNYTDGDTMVLHMNMLTNHGGGAHGLAGDKAYVDHLFGFSAVLGSDYSGAWEGGETQRCADGGATTLHPCFVIHLLDTRGGAAVSGGTLAAPSIHIRSASGKSAQIRNRLSGDRGRRLAPLLVDFYAYDHDNSAAGHDSGDTLTLVFDKPTDVGVSPPQPWGSGVGAGATSGGAGYVDSLFRFCDGSCPRDDPSPLALANTFVSHGSRVSLGADYRGQWTDESTFVVTLLDVLGCELQIGRTVVQTRHAGDLVSSRGAAATPTLKSRPIRFRGGISDFGNSTSPPLRGKYGGAFGSSAAPQLSAFVARDLDSADTSYGAFDELEVRFSMPTDRGHLPVLSGDKRFVDRYFDFSCNLGLDYSGAWADPSAVRVTILDGTVGYSPQQLLTGSDGPQAGLSAAARQLGTLRVTPSPHASFRNKPRTSAVTPTGVLRAEPPLRGSAFPSNAGKRLCDGATLCDFGDYSAPELETAYVSDLDNSGSWTEHDQLVLTFDRPTNRLGQGSLDTQAIRAIFEFRATTVLLSADLGSADATRWTLGSELAGSWTDSRTLVIEAMRINATEPSEAMPDPTQCGLVDAMGDVIECPKQRAMGGSTGAAQQGFIVPGGQGFKLRVIINGTAGLRAESNSPNAQMTGGVVDFTGGAGAKPFLSHCYAGVLVASASIRDPDNLDEVFSNGDELTIKFTVETRKPDVSTKFHIDKLLTFCTPCNPGCERSPLGSIFDREYNGLGTEYSGHWDDEKTLVITMLNVTLPTPGECYQNDGNPDMAFTPNAWRVMPSFSAAEAPDRGCWPGAPGYDPTICSYGEVTGTMTYDQFGNGPYELHARQFGPRYPHRWTTTGCEDYLRFRQDYQLGIYSTIGLKPISGSVGAVGTPAIDRVVASDPDDLDLAYGAGDTLTVVFGIATDRSEDTQPGVHSGDRLFVDSLFAFNAQLGQDYSGEWLDDSQFVVTIIDAGWRPAPQFDSAGQAMAASNCTASVRANVVVRNLASTSLPLNGTSPELSGNVGLDAPPKLISIRGEDPDLGDATVSSGDRITLAFDRATDLGCASVGSPGVAGGASGGDVPCPYVLGGRIERDAVDEIWNFSVPIGRGYEGSWTDASTFVLTIIDGTDSALDAELGSIVVNPIAGKIANQGCRPRTPVRLTDRAGNEGLCNTVSEFVGPIVPFDGGGANRDDGGGPPALPPFSARFGVPPAIVAVEVDDPDSSDSVYSAGDRVRVYFDQATDMASSAANGYAVAGDRAYVDSLMSFSMPLGLQYMGVWDDASTFTVTIISTLPVPDALKATYLEGVSVNVHMPLRDATSRSRPSKGMATATADEAALRSRFPVYNAITPIIVNVTAEDPDNGDATFGTGDVIRVHFSVRTDRGANKGPKAFVDRLFRFDPPIGTDYTGAWLTDQTFEVRALDTVGGELRICNHDGCAPRDRSNVTLVGTLRNRGGTSPVAASSKHISGISDAGAPQLTSFVVSDPDNADYVFSNDDQVTVTFDRASDLGAVEAKRKRVDALFSFNIPLGEDYSGQWMDESVFGARPVPPPPLLQKKSTPPRWC